MRTAELIRAMLAIAVAAVTAAGCSQSTEGTATGQGSASTSLPADFFDIFNPCDSAQMTDQALTEAGLDPATKGTVTDAKQGDTAWRVCAWRSTDNQFFVTVFSTVHKLEASRNKDSLINKRDTTIGGRAAQVAQEKTDPEGCYASMEADQGMFEVSAGWTRHGSKNQDICEVAKEYATALEPHLPK